jgi:hypothetical protein
MGWSFRRSVRIAPGVRLNFGKRGMSTSVGPRGLRMTFRSDGSKRTTVRIPGTGLSYSEEARPELPPSGAENSASPNDAGRGPGLATILFVAAVLIAVLVIALH